MVTNIGDVLSAYSKSGGLNSASSPASSVSSAGGESFGNMVKDFIGGSVDALHEGESKAMETTTGGKADLASVVTAMDNAEVALTEIVTFRDKIIAAYQAITSSAI